MRKIPTLFVRNTEDRSHVTDEVTPGCEWVLEGEGVATRKWDGTCVYLAEDGSWWARREVKAGKVPPDNYQPIEHDKTTGKTVGWEPIKQSPFVKFHAEAVENLRNPATGHTYELCGPKINGNPEGLPRHSLVEHPSPSTLEDYLPDILHGHRPYDRVKAVVTGSGWEGLVFHHPDGRMAKIKAKDFPKE